MTPVNSSRYYPTVVSTIPSLKKIMLIEDDQDDSSFIAEIIERFYPTYSLINIDTAAAALNILKEYQSSELPNLIIIDYQLLPITGLDLLKEIKQSYLFRHIPVAVYSSSAYYKHKTECLEAGACIYLTKPNTVQEIKEDLSKMLSFCS